MPFSSAHSMWPQPRVPVRARRWILGTLAMSAVFWLMALVAVLALANRVHDDIPALLAAKLPLLKNRPTLIFAGESRTAYQIDPVLAAQLIGKPPGAVVNLGYDAGEPLLRIGACACRIRIDDH